MTNVRFSLIDKGSKKMEEITKIKDLSPSSRRVNVLGKVLTIGETKDIQTRMGEQKQVTEVVIGDDTGKVTMSLWGDQLSKVGEGKNLYIENGYITLVRGHMHLNVGKYGSINESQEDITDINEELDMSEQEHERRYRSYGDSFGRYSGGRSYGRR